MIPANATLSTIRTGLEPSARDCAPPTAREAQLVTLIAQGFSNKIIAQELNISPNTVRSHISNIMRKYKLRNRTQVAMLLMPQIGMRGSMSLMR